MLPWAMHAGVGRLGAHHFRSPKKESLAAGCTMDPPLRRPPLLPAEAKRELESWLARSLAAALRLPTHSARLSYIGASLLWQLGEAPAPSAGSGTAADVDVTQAVRELRVSFAKAISEAARTLSSDLREPLARIVARSLLCSASSPVHPLAQAASSTSGTSAESAVQRSEAGLSAMSAPARSVCTPSSEHSSLPVVVLSPSATAAAPASASAAAAAELSPSSLQSGCSALSAAADATEPAPALPPGSSASLAAAADATPGSSSESVPDGSESVPDGSSESAPSSSEPAPASPESPTAAYGAAADATAAALPMNAASAPADDHIVDSAAAAAAAAEAGGGAASDGDTVLSRASSPAYGDSGAARAGGSSTSGGGAAANSLTGGAEESGDEHLGRLLKDVLRHQAREAGVEISPDGWVTVSDALEFVNLRTSRPTPFTEAAVREEVARNPKRRFQLADKGDAGLFIRASQGHSIAGVGEEIGTPLTKATAPHVAVHGTYLRHLDTILTEGLGRMQRHHVHLARGLLGEPGIVSGMRWNTEVYVWVRATPRPSSGPVG